MSGIQDELQTAKNVFDADVSREHIERLRGISAQVADIYVRLGDVISELKEHDLAVPWSLREARDKVEEAGWETWDAAAQFSSVRSEECQRYVAALQAEAMERLHQEAGDEARRRGAKP